ncbi:hypothetical protein CDL12_19597 [Handroanthus impetiginosus]|uniref:Uncharacterized protein n=1 Tax=Handroanthus impetiginosus TaxID=429701 RepID=A0A2G9GRE7_9LAMI|nr:hypothetical protein CDL12_19597 [Handroanthus impetiginosus]
MSSSLSLSTILPKTQNPVISALLPTNSRSFSTLRSFHFPPVTPTNLVKSNKSPHFSSHPLYAAAEAPPEEDEEPAIGDCLVYEEGIFDDPYLQTTQNFRNDVARVRVRKRTNKDPDVSPENLIPEQWSDVQRELNITKKERRKISQQLEYGRRVEKRRQALKPINLEEYEKFKNEKLKQLNPVVLDKPDPTHFRENDENGDDERRGDDIRDRVAPRSPRVAVYGGGLEDISAHFSNESYDPVAADKSQGPRKLFSKEEKSLMNRRVPDLAVATSGKWHPLHTLAASGEFYLVNSLLKHGLDINAPDKDGLTAIHRAILGKKQAVFNFLLRESANPFVRDSEGATLMHYAVFTASSQMIKILLLYNVDINLQDDEGWTPLHLAVQSRRTDIVRLLLIKGADQTLKNRDGLTPLDLCLYSGRDTRTYELIRLLKKFLHTSGVGPAKLNYLSSK